LGREDYLIGFKDEEGKEGERKEVLLLRNRLTIVVNSTGSELRKDICKGRFKCITIFHDSFL
jgi:hypothetical protein